MTVLYSLGSGSKGNCFAVSCDGTVVLIDAGFSAREIERRLGQVGLALGQVAGVILTHEHGDHTAGVRVLARKLRRPVLASAGTWERLRGRVRAEHRPIGMTATVELGPFVVRACPTSHDAAEPVAVSVCAADGAAVGVAYDLGRPTTAVRYLLQGVAALVVETNHDEILLRTSDYPPSVQQRIAGSGGHLSNRAAAELLVEMHHPGLQAVVLAHISQRCNSEQLARGAVEPALRAVGYAGEVWTARQDEPLPPIRLRGAIAGMQLRLDVG